MLDGILQYISLNASDLTKDVVINVIFLLVSIVVSKRLIPSNDSSNFHYTHILTREEIIKEVIVYRTWRHSSCRASDRNGDDLFRLMFVAGIVLAYLYSKYHAQIIDMVIGVLIAGVTSTIILGTSLAYHRMYNQLLAWWIFVQSVVWITVGLNLWFMLGHDFSNVKLDSIHTYITSAGIFRVTEILYTVIGLAAAFIVILLALLLHLHMYALNWYKYRQGKISVSILRRTSGFLNKPVLNTLVIFAICIVSLLFSSGSLHHFIVQQLAR
jgi:hypothetical protein